MSKVNTLFIHMGPGMSSEPEKTAFEKQYSHVDFWNQPAISNPDRTYTILCESVKIKIEKLAQSEGKINIIAHSFGGHLAKSCLETHSKYINECQFIATSFDIHGTAKKLLRYLSNDERTSIVLKKEYQNYLSTHESTNNFWEVFSLITKDSDFGRAYWYRPENYLRYQTYSKNSTFDVQTFSLVLNDFFLRETRLIQSPYQGPITFYIGTNDIFMDFSTEEAIWRQHFPQANFVKVENAGHMPHFEQNIPFI